MVEIFLKLVERSRVLVRGKAEVDDGFDFFFKNQVR